MLGEIYNSCYDTANSLKGWQKMNKNDIANLYLDNRGTDRGNVYGAALLCRYWYKVGLIWKNNKNSMSQEDCYAIVWDGIEKAMDYAAWRNPQNTLYQDPNGPDKAINVCIDSTKKIYYAFSNRDKRKLNYAYNTLSLDAFVEKFDDFLGDIDQEKYFIDNDGSSNDLNIRCLIDDFIKDDMLPEAIITEVICYGDSILDRVENGIVTKEFSERKFISTIHNLDANYVKSFSETYDVDINYVKECLEKINNLSLFLLHSLIDRTLYIIKNKKGFGYVY